jgi:hypothetical protein
MVVDSKKKLLSTPEIVVKSVQASDLNGIPVYAVLMGLMKEMSLPDAEVKQFGNTVFIGHRARQNKNWIICKLITIDSSKNLIDNCEAYVKFLVDSKIEKMATAPFESKQISNMIKVLERKPFAKNWVFNWAPPKNNKTMVVIEFGNAE